MSGLVTSLAGLLTQADQNFELGRIAAARQGYGELLERSQERSDRGMEVIARSMLGRCALRRRDVDGARQEIDQAGRRLVAQLTNSVARYRSARARLAVAAGHDWRPTDRFDYEAGRTVPENEPRDWVAAELASYLGWAQEAEAWDCVVDACVLLAERSDVQDRLDWLQRAVDCAVEHELEASSPLLPSLGKAYGDLAAALSDVERLEEALDAYQSALAWFSRRGDDRQVVMATWAVGATAVRCEDWPLAQARLLQAVALAEQADECLDLLGLALADLARVHEASGDPIEARHVMLRALSLGREQDLPNLWEDRWLAMLRYARVLELDV